MLTDILTNKWIVGAAFLLPIIAAGCILYYQHTTAQDKQEAAEADKQLKQWEVNKTAKPQAETELTQEPAESENAENTIITTTLDSETADTNESEPHADSTTIEIDSMEIAAESPYGFGPYPEVPQDYIEKYGKPIWLYSPEKLPTSTLRNVELIDRVKIQKWNDGDREFTNGIYENGKIYLNYPNTFYVRFENITLPDGTELRYISSVTSGQKPPLTPEQFLAGEIPIGVNLIDLDSEDPGIDPFEFLGLE